MSCCAGSCYESSAGVPIAKVTGKLTLKVTLRQAENEMAPKVTVEGFLGTLHVLLSPRQLSILREIAEGMAAQGVCVCVCVCVCVSELFFS